MRDSGGLELFTCAFKHYQFDQSDMRVHFPCLKKPTTSLRAIDIFSMAADEERKSGDAGMQGHWNDIR
jgi:hypothetical protein